MSHRQTFKSTLKKTLTPIVTTTFSCLRWTAWIDSLSPLKALPHKYVQKESQIQTHTRPALKEPRSLLQAKPFKGFYGSFFLYLNVQCLPVKNLNTAEADFHCITEPFFSMFLVTR